LDALHLATALIYRDNNGDEITFMTHDKELARIATAMGFSVVGV
jgi:predicted nucleic acid-binding protein